MPPCKRPTSARRSRSIEVKLIGSDSRQTFGGAPSAFGPLLTFAPAHPQRSARGQVARGTFSGPRSRGTRCGPRAAAPSTPTKHGKSQDTANGTCARTPNHLPWLPGCTPAHRPSPWVAAGRWWYPRAQAPFAVSWLLPSLDGDDAAVRGGGPRCRPASVGRRTGVPPPPWGTVARGPGLRGQPRPPALAPTHGRKADAQRAAMGREQPLTMRQCLVRLGSRETRWSN
jgi:hypothetical protein